MCKIARGGDYSDDVSSFANGTNDREACSKRWIAALVRVNCEKRTSSLLNKTGYETFVPTLQEIHEWSDRKKKVNRLLMPMIVFIRATVKDELWLRNQSYISKLLALPGSDEDKKRLATPIPDSQISQLQHLLSSANDNVSIESHSFVNGDEVEVICGPLKGITGFVQIAANSHTLLIEVGFLGYAKISIEKTFLRKI